MTGAPDDLDEFLTSMRLDDLAKACRSNVPVEQIRDALRRFDLLQADIEGDAPPAVPARRLQ